VNGTDVHSASTGGLCPNLPVRGAFLHTELAVSIAIAQLGRAMCLPIVPSADQAVMCAAAKAPSGAAFRSYIPQFALTEAVLRLNLCRSAVPPLSLFGGRLSRPLGS